MHLLNPNWGLWARTIHSHSSDADPAIVFSDNREKGVFMIHQATFFCCARPFRDVGDVRQNEANMLNEAECMRYARKM
jgi:hypothetical protein